MSEADVEPNDTVAEPPQEDAQHQQQQQQQKRTKKAPAQDKEARDAIPLAAIASAANATSTFTVCLVTTLIYGGYRTESICPISNLIRLVVNLLSPTLYASYKGSLSELCEEEDSCLRFFYDLYPKSLITNTDSLPQLITGAISFLGAASIHLLVVLYTASAVYALRSVLAVNLQLLVLQPLALVLGSGVSARVQYTLEWATWLLNLPLSLPYTYVLEPLGRFVCTIPPRLFRALRLPARDPFFLFYAFGARRPRSPPEAPVGRCQCSLRALAFHFQQCAGALTKSVVSLFLLTFALRLACILTGLGPSLVRALAGSAFYERELRKYRLLTFGGLLERPVSDLGAALAARLAALLTPTTGALLLALVAASLFLHRLLADADAEDALELAKKRL